MTHNKPMNEDTQAALGSAPALQGIENHRQRIIDNQRNALEYMLRYLRNSPEARNYNSVHGGVSGPDAIAIGEAALMQHPPERTAA